MRTPEEHATAATIITLMQGVVYRQANEATWTNLDRFEAQIRDHFSLIGVDVVIDQLEGYAYLRTNPVQEGEEALPPLVRKRALTYGASLLLVLLRKRLLEFDASGEEGKLVVNREKLSEMMRVFLPDSTNEVRSARQVDSAISKATELGFLRPLRGQGNLWEVQRILKAYVDAEVLGDLDHKLATYTGKEGDD
ncbi:DUF4194 domain-containing protein [Actinomycetaceae bacterium WB03_NA08]|uniref:DUF4194 domain-containing protein n=1 Tax=Scrofimicrobium canadense TaxID=2652290 RepID=A0A6N7VRC9_9ACTO|nr:DUF4194 domain-containing protein [Scrofimicrobium canadense]MSS84309.1 DUF4194 domain-containing protein [Scrofimicrobium canadense]